MPKRILFACTDLMAVQFMLPHILFQKEQGNHIELLCSNVGSRVEELQQKLSQDENIPVHVVSLCRSPFSLTNFKGYQQLRHFLLNNHFDILATNEPVMGAITRIAAKSIKFKGKVIYTSHGFHFYKGGNIVLNYIYYAIERQLSKLTDVMITINHDDYVASLSFQKANPNLQCHLVNGMGVDLERFKCMSAKERHLERLKNNFNIDDILVICTGELNTNKNQQVILRGAAPLIKRNPKLKLLFAGKGNQEKKLKELAKRLKIESNTFFLGYRKDIEKVIGMSDIASSASLREGLGLNLIEAMSCGLPIVCSTNRAHNDIMKSGAIGKLFDTHNIATLTEAIETTINNINSIHIKNNNHERANQYSIDKIRPQYFETLIS